MKKNVLITGATGNLGKSVVEQFLSEGYRVIITVTHEKDPGFEKNEDLIPYQADLTNEAESASVVQQIIQSHQTINAAILLVGGFAAGDIASADLASVHKMISLNFDTAYNIARPVFQSMKASANGGSIIMIGSKPALYPNEGKDYLAYSLSKSMLFKLAEFMNASGAQSNIVTSVIVPGTIDTPANRKAMPKADFSKWVDPIELAKGMVYLCSDQGKSLREPVLKFFGKN